MRQLKVEVCREITLKCYVHTKYRQTVHGSASRNSNCQSRKYVWWLQHVVFIAVNSYYLFGCARTKWGKMFTESTQVSAKIWSHKWKWKWMWESVWVYFILREPNVCTCDFEKFELNEPMKKKLPPKSLHRFPFRPQLNVFSWWKMRCTVFNVHWTTETIHIHTHINIYIHFVIVKSGIEGKKLV